jgi:hypothetical protein
MTGRRKPLRARVLRVCALALLGVVLFELGVRILSPGFDINPSWRYHPALGWSQVPSGRFDYEVDGERVWIGFNREGFHDVEHEIEKPAGTKRIVLIGDSFSESVQVNLEQTFFRLLEDALNAAGAGRWEVINLGVGDFGTAQECLALEHLGLRYSPDIVLCQIFPLNDIGNNTIELYDLCKSRNDRYRPYFVEDGGSLRLTSAQPARSFLRRASVSYGVLEGLLLRATGAFAPQDDSEYRAALQARGFQVEPIVMTFLDERDQPAEIARGWRVTERILERIVERCRAHGAAFVGMVVPWDRCVGPAWEVFARTQPLPLQRDYPERRLGALFERLGVPSLMLLELFERNRDVVLPARAGHLNPAAHRLVADAILAKLRAERLAP